MNKKILQIIMIVYSLFFVSCQSEKEKIISNAVKYTLTTTSNKEIKIDASKEIFLSKEFNNKIVLLNFWATWCKPCIKEMPNLVELQEKYKDDFIIVAVLFEKKYDKNKLEKFLKKFDVNFPVTVGDENFILADVLDDVKMIPESFLYGKDGMFIRKFTGEISKSKLEKYIKKYQ